MGHGVALTSADVSVEAKHFYMTVSSNELIFGARRISFLVPERRLLFHLQIA